MRMVLFLTTAFFIAASLAVWPAHADEFGNRFYGEAPPALGDYTAPDDALIAQDDDLARDLQDIMPAAGEETDDEELGAPPEFHNDSETSQETE